MRFLLVLLLLLGSAVAAEIKVYTIVTGKVAKVFVKEGERVKRGQLLMNIDPAIYAAEKEKLLGRKKELEAKLWKVERDYNRLKELFDRDLLAESTLEDKKIEYDTLKAQLQQVEGEIKRVEVFISYTEITSPVDGRIVKILAPEGSYVNGELQAQPVIIIQSPSR
ncbi:gold/copper resistance efflux system membrane fusion protein [Hydrogenivirga caldilitoris]|uniref:Gold/copper resistance efflux system membrane fusion protein n=1 Tax=Hydrogenivirga caldilitoris TaxID=246264 RepID=A0A497XQJ3_9AQUI|nr:efflux RND transporter periplasmic adaptor subunit [Hydrogenivirga caldilitoris]RLJ70524.1 gold/copper resistance efflux system membrane fusion protein [Hydrogenivirga caldilitoris]